MFVVERFRVLRTDLESVQAGGGQGGPGLRRQVVRCSAHRLRFRGKIVDSEEDERTAEADRFRVTLRELRHEAVMEECLRDCRLFVDKSCSGGGLLWQCEGAGGLFDIRKVGCNKMRLRRLLQAEL